MAERKNPAGNLAAIAAVALVLAKCVLIAAGISVVFAAVCATPIAFLLGVLAAGELIDLARSRRPAETVVPAVVEA